MADTKPLFRNVPGLGELHYFHAMGDDMSPMVCVCVTAESDRYFFCFCRSMNPITWGIASVTSEAFDDLLFKKCKYSDLFKQAEQKMVVHCGDTGDTYKKVDSVEDLMGPLSVDYFDDISTDFICCSEFVQEILDNYDREKEK